MRALLAVCVALVATPAAAGPPAWVEVRSAHFTVITNAGDGAGRQVAWQFEQIRSGLVKIWPWAKIQGPPFVIFAARDEATLKTLGPQFWEGKQFRPASFWVGGAEGRFVALRSDVQEPNNVSDNPYQMAYWAYANAVFTGAFPRRIPVWYGRGMAELISNTFVRDKELQVGRPMRANLQELRERAPIPLAEFLAVDKGSRWITQEAGIRLFDAQAWAFVHYLLFGEERRHAPALDRFNRLLHDGVEEPVALKEAFGEDMRPLFEGLRGYVSRQVFQYARIVVAPDMAPDQYTIRPLSPGESAALRGGLLVAMGRPVEARAFAAEAAKADPALPGPWEIEGALQDREGHAEEAREAYAKAVAAGSKSARVHYRLAQLEWKPGGDKALWERLAARLEVARELDPTHANTLSFLADLKSSLGQPEEAFALAKQAVELEPAESYHRLTLARALLNLQRPDEALQAAQSALKTADSDSERQQVQEFLEYAARSRR